MRVVWLTLLVGCGFEHGSLSTMTPGGGDAGPTSDAPSMMVDAARLTTDAADAPSTNTSWVVIETLTVPVNGTTVTSQTALGNGVTYHLRASGTFVIQSPQGTQADAEFWDFGNLQDGVAGVDCGLAVDDTNVDTNKTPKWGAYAASHVYEIAWVGDGTTIVAMLHDGNFTNNTGSLSLAILNYQ